LTELICVEHVAANSGLVVADGLLTSLDLLARLERVEREVVTATFVDIVVVIVGDRRRRYG
jgi:hypothetical protein